MQASLAHVLRDFDKQIDSSKDLILNVKDVGLTRIQIEIITELAFLKIFIAWENFLEESFIRYLVGARSPSRFKPRRLINPRIMSHALDILSSDREYVNWNSASFVISRAERCFREGRPYRNAIQAATVDLNDMNTIRNRIAHKSTVSKEKFNNFIRRKFGHGKRGMTPGRFLLTSLNASTTDRFLDYYVDIMRTASSLIIP